jgi:hypothetical protein
MSSCFYIFRQLFCLASYLFTLSLHKWFANRVLEQVQLRDFFSSFSVLAFGRKQEAWRFEVTMGVWGGSDHPRFLQLFCAALWTALRHGSLQLMGNSDLSGILESACWANAREQQVALWPKFGC